MQGLEMSDHHVTVAEQLTAPPTSYVPTISALSDSRVRRVSKRVLRKKSSQWAAHPVYVEETHVCVDTTDGYSEHTVKIRVRQNDKSDQVTHGKDPGEETRLDGTTNKSVQNCICLAETSARTGEDDDQSNL